MMSEIVSVSWSEPTALSAILLEPTAPVPISLELAVSELALKLAVAADLLPEKSTALSQK